MFNLELKHEDQVLSDALQHDSSYKDQLVKRLQLMQEVKHDLEVEQENLQEILKAKDAKLKEASLSNHHMLKQVICRYLIYNFCSCLIFCEIWQMESKTDGVVDDMVQLSNVYEVSDLFYVTEDLSTVHRLFGKNISGKRCKKTFHSSI